MNKRQIEISKIISYALRHAPASYCIKLDENGWIRLSELIKRLNNNGNDINERDVIDIVEATNKKRHEILDGKIRALYGHSSGIEIMYDNQMPPDTLFHATPSINMDRILIDGLLPMERNHVHLSNNLKNAKLVAKRKSKIITVLSINAREAFNDGIKFFHSGDDIWQSPAIPAIYINNG